MPTSCCRGPRRPGEQYGIAGVPLVIGIVLRAITWMHRRRGSYHADAGAAAVPVVGDRHGEP